MLLLFSSLVLHCRQYPLSVAAFLFPLQQFDKIFQVVFKNVDIAEVYISFYFLVNDDDDSVVRLQQFGGNFQEVSKKKWHKKYFLSLTSESFADDGSNRNSCSILRCWRTHRSLSNASVRNEVSSSDTWNLVDVASLAALFSSSCFKLTSQPLKGRRQSQHLK